ncbi:hypothetical protein GCM10011504_57090 [Siccirubricoccus deserti]|nr:hypothetical protein GCM10011504_57090 [Siccirubricoccus deserti]
MFRDGGHLSPESCCSGLLLTRSAPKLVSAALGAALPLPEKVGTLPEVMLRLMPHDRRVVLPPALRGIGYLP